MNAVNQGGQRESGSGVGFWSFPDTCHGEGFFWLK